MATVHTDESIMPKNKKTWSSWNYRVEEKNGKLIPTTNMYFKKCSELLKKNGILALQVITCPVSRFESLRKGVDWIQKYIFPGSSLHSVAAINNAVNNTTDMTLVDLKDIGLHYATTLVHWLEQFSKNISKIKELGFNDQFIRKWNYYFPYCEAEFVMRNINVMQMVYVRPNNVLR